MRLRGEDLDATEAEKSERLKAEILSLREQIKIANTKIQQLKQTALKILKTKIYVFTLDSRIVKSTKQC